jgi:hemerythrin superfamily protein
MKAVEYHAQSEESKLFPEVKKMDPARLNEIATKLKEYRTKNNM